MKYMIKKLTTLIITLLLVSMVTFVAFSVIPGDAAIAKLGTEATEELKKEIQTYVKQRTAPYKYPRIVEFKTELPKTTSGKIIRNKL